MHPSSTWMKLGQEFVHDGPLLFDVRCLENGVSRNTGDLIEVCIMLATKMCLAVASGSTENGVP